MWSSLLKPCGVYVAFDIDIASEIIMNILLIFDIPQPQCVIVCEVCVCEDFSLFCLLDLVFPVDSWTLRLISLSYNLKLVTRNRNMLNCAAYIFIRAPWIHVPRSYFLLNLACLDRFTLLYLLSKLITHSQCSQVYSQTSN